MPEFRFEVVAPHGAAGVIDIGLRKGDNIQSGPRVRLHGFVDTDRIVADLMIDGAVVLTSYSALVRSVPPDAHGCDHELLFTFPSPPWDWPPQRFELRYRACRDGVWFITTMEQP